MTRFYKRGNNFRKMNETNAPITLEALYTPESAYPETVTIQSATSEVVVTLTSGFNIRKRNAVCDDEDFEAHSPPYSKVVINNSFEVPMDSKNWILTGCLEKTQIITYV